MAQAAEVQELHWSAVGFVMWLKMLVSFLDAHPFTESHFLLWQPGARPEAAAGGLEGAAGGEGAADWDGETAAGEIKDADGGWEPAEGEP